MSRSFSFEVTVQYTATVVITDTDLVEKSVKDARKVIADPLGHTKAELARARCMLLAYEQDGADGLLSVGLRGGIRSMREDIIRELNGGPLRVARMTPISSTVVPTKRARAARKAIAADAKCGFLGEPLCRFDSDPSVVGE